MRHTAGLKDASLWDAGREHFLCCRNKVTTLSLYITNVMRYWQMTKHVRLDIILYALALVHYFSHLPSCHRWSAGCYNDMGAFGSAGWLMRCPKQKRTGAYEYVWTTVPVVDLRGINQTIHSNQWYLRQTQRLIFKVTFTKMCNETVKLFIEFP